MPQNVFDGLSASLEPIAGLKFFPLQMLNLKKIRSRDLQFGYKIGLLDAEAVVQIETERSQLGLPGDRLQNDLAIILKGDIEAVEEVFSKTPDVEVINDSIARKKWLEVILRMSLNKWDSEAGDPFIESAEILSAWGEEGRYVWESIRPKGMDSAFFGDRAKKRFLSRLRDLLSRDSLNLTSRLGRSQSRHFPC